MAGIVAGYVISYEEMTFTLGRKLLCGCNNVGQTELLRARRRPVHTVQDVFLK